MYKYIKKKGDDKVWLWRQKEIRVMEMSHGQCPSGDSGGLRTQSVVLSGCEVDMLT
jgi:hypothetical protein